MNGITSNGCAHDPTELLSRFEDVRAAGKDKWQCRCPSHDDNRASLSVSRGDGGKLVLHCHAGCDTRDVLGAVGARMSDLFPTDAPRNGTRKIVASYDYKDSDGVLLFQAIRYDPKDFRQRRPDGNGGWDWSVKGCKVVPYRLPELVAAGAGSEVFIVEGEKDVDRLTREGAVATCNAGGAGKWTKQHAEYLTGYSVTIIADNDDPGRKHAEQVADSLINKAAAVKIVRQLPGVPDKGDVSDFLNNGGSVGELIQLAEVWQQGCQNSDNLNSSPSNSAKPRRCTDVGNAERFAEQHGADVRFCHQWKKWLVWDGRRWKLDNDGEIPRRAKRTARNILVEASKIEDSQERLQLSRWANTSERRERQAAMVALAESEQPIPVTVNALDADPYLWNCENGTLDLRTGELREHRREDYLTKLCPLEYPNEGGCDPDIWLDFLDKIFAGSAPLIRFIQQLAGLAMVGEVREHILPIYYGSGANGKSVWLETICGMFGGDYAMNAPAGLLMATKSERHPTALADLHGKRFVAAVETQDGGRLSEALVKELTGGDSIRARRMREDFWQFRPSHTVVLATNHKPTIRGTDHGIWRRIRLVPFTVTIPDHQQDKQLAFKLRREWPQILRWCVSGCLDWQRNGLVAPAEVADATNSYRGESDVLAQFLEERCIVDPDADARASDLFNAYKEWATNRGEYPGTQTRFGLRLVERGFTKGRDGGSRVVYFGIGLAG